MRLRVQRGEETLEMSLIFCDRKSMEIAVYPDRSIELRAPLGSDLNTVEKKVQKRFTWIKKQLRFFDQFHPRTPPRQFISGESHLYLGKTYRLKAIYSNVSSVVLKDGYITVHTPSIEPDEIKKKLGQWYSKQAKRHFQMLLEDCFIEFSEKVALPKLQIKNMKSRWGSLSKSGILTLNTDLIRAPKECIRYIVFHELCHLIHPDHSNQFYNLLAHVFSDWKQRKTQLESRLS